MLTVQTYQNRYQYLAQFSDPNSPTYTRRSKKGKMVVVKKGKRGKGKLWAKVGGAAGGVLGGLYGSGLLTQAIQRKYGINTANPMMAAQQLRMMRPRTHSALAGVTLGASGVGGYAGYKLGKRLTSKKE